MIENFQVDEVEIPFSPSWKKISISLSGGADSALLAYLICDHIESLKLEHFQIHIINHKRCWKTKPWQTYDSLKVYRFLKEKFNTLDFFRHENFIPPDIEWGDKGRIFIDEYDKKVSGDNIELRSFAEYICFVNDIDAYYNAVTKNPTGVDFQGMDTRNIEPHENNQHLRLMKHMDRWAIHPFRFVEKSWIIKQYFKLGLDNLLDMTRSCEGEIEGIDYKTYKPYQYIPTCGACFWCKEREWAIEQNK